MSEATLLPAAERVQVPWKNGGGVTQTVAAFPNDAGPDDFMWRVSVAQVRTAGPFSAFPETDRHLSVLEGTLLLEVANQPSMLSPASAGLAFPGDVAASGTPIDGPVLDLNVMTRRGQFRAEVERLSSNTPVPIDAEVAILVATAPAHVACGRTSVALDRLDALIMTNHAGQLLSVTAGGPAHLIQIFAQSRSSGLGEANARP
jgi:environmental stress-induced protein Ves